MAEYAIQVLANRGSVSSLVGETISQVFISKASLARDILGLTRARVTRA